MTQEHFYTSVDEDRGTFLFRGYLDGKRAHYKDKSFKPYLFIPSKEDTEYKTLQGEPVEKVVFKNSWEAKEYQKRYEGMPSYPIYGMSNWVYPYIYDQFGINIPHNAALITIANLDIEVMSNEGFPNPKDASKKVTAITVRSRGTAYVFGLHAYNPQRLRDEGIEPAKNVKYLRCADEKDLLDKFLSFWKALDPDIVTGWNVNGFDIPYLINRIAKVWDNDQEALRLSPWGKIEWRTVEIFKKEQLFAKIVGITILDYLEMYKKFVPGSRESFKLDYIGKYEKVDVVKFDYEELGYKNLHDLYQRNYDLYIHYNIIDTEVVDNLEAKLKLIQLVITMSYNSGLNFQDAMTTVRLWDVTIHGYLMTKGIVVPPTTRRSDKYDGIEGAYVKDPVIGLSEWVCSFDVNSLYPSLIRQCNISPETYITTISKVTVDSLLNSDPAYQIDLDAPPSAMLEALRKNGASLCGTGCIFDNAVQGFYPYLMEYYYGERTKYKRQLKDAKNQLKALKEIKGNLKDIEKLERDVSTFDMLQYSFKIMLNSAYGALSNKGYRWFDPKLSESVTKSGQLTIRWVERDINAHLNKLLGTVDQKFVIYCDTDSAYVRLSELVKARWSDLPASQIVDKVDEFCKTVIEPIIEESFARFTKHFNHRENVLVMKREAIAAKGIWTAKKRYILNVWDMEGFRYDSPQLKMQGIEAVKSSTPSAAREFIKEGLKVIMNGTKTEFITFMTEKRAEFETKPYGEVAFPRSCNNLTGYTNSTFIYNKGCPIHVRGALMFNHVVTKMGLQDEIKLIENGDKIKFCHLKPNPTGENVFATTGDLPKQLKMESYINYKMQFEKGVVDPIRAICDAIHWPVEHTPSLQDLFICE